MNVVGMPPTTLHLLGSLAVPLIQWLRYILIVPALIAWGVLLVFAADFAGGGLAGAIEYIVFLPVAGWYFIEGLFNPALSPSLTDDTWLEAVGEDPYGFFIRAALVGSLLLWAIRSAWRRVRPGSSSPADRGIWQSLRRSTGWAVGVTSLFLLTSLLFPHYRTQDLGLAGNLFLAILVLLVLLVTGWWVTLVDVGMDGLIGRISGSDPATPQSEGVKYAGGSD